MSIRLMSAAWELDIPQTEKMVLLCLCDHANDEGECWPSVTRLARKCSVTDRTVQKAIQGLRDKQILAWDDAPGRSHKFTIDPRRIFAPENPSPPKITTQPPKQVHPTPENASDEPSRTINYPSEVGASDDALTPQEVVEEWNELASAKGLPLVRKLTSSRKRRLQARLRAFPDIEDWQRAFQTIRDTPWMHGNNDRGWRADFDFLLQDKSFTKLTEGAYGQA